MSEPERRAGPVYLDEPKRDVTASVMKQMLFAAIGGYVIIAMVGMATGNPTAVDEYAKFAMDVLPWAFGGRLVQKAVLGK